MRTRHVFNLGFIVLALSFSFPTFAALLTPEGQGGVLEKVVLPQHVQATVEGTTQKLTSVGFGLRTKKVVFVNVKVYLGQFFVSDLASFDKKEALNSAKKQKSLAIQMHFLRSVEGEKVQKSFQEALQANGISLTDSDVQQFLEVVKNSGEAKEGHKISIVGTNLAEEKQAILFENTQGQISEIKSSPGFVEKIFSIWLGKPSDSGVANLKSAILN